MQRVPVRVPLEWRRKPQHSLFLFYSFIHSLKARAQTVQKGSCGMTRENGAGALRLVSGLGLIPPGGDGEEHWAVSPEIRF